MSNPDPSASTATETPSAPAPAIPPLRKNATPEEQDLLWFTHVYQGDKQRQLTLRAVLMGGVLGMFMSISNLYTVLKLGWSFGVAITACVLSFVIWNGLRALSGGRLPAMSMLETNCMQSTASAAGYTTGTTVGTALAAVYLIQGGHHQPWTVVVPFVLLSAMLGVFLAIPMKRQMINHEQLPFPSGIAAAETIRSLYSKGAEALHKAWALVAALIVSGIIGFIKGAEQLIGALKEGSAIRHFFEKIHGLVSIPELMNLPQPALSKPGVQLASLGFEPGVLMVGAGMIMGLRAALSMLLGSFVLYYVLMPVLLSADMAHTGEDGWRASLRILGGSTIVPRHWGVWGGTSLMVFSSLASLALQWRTIARAFRFGSNKAAGAQADALAAIEVPGRWLVIGLVPITIGLVILLQAAFDVTVWMGLIAVALSFVLAMVACRATGETDTTPVGPMGKVTQFIYAALAPKNTVINLMSAGTTAAAAASAADLLTDLKSGYLLGANPRRQFLAQFAGVFFGTLAVVPCWYALASSPEVINKFPMPATNAWRAMAELLAAGVQNLPASARSAVVFGGLLGLALPLAETLLPMFRNWVPSAMGLGLGFVVDFSNSFSFAIGGVITLIWTRMNRRHADTFNIPVASGFVAGESLVLAIIAIICAFLGLLAAK